MNAAADLQGGTPEGAADVDNVSIFIGRSPNPTLTQKGGDIPEP